MRLKLDENLSRHLKPILAGLGHDVLTAADENLLSRPDTVIAAAAFKEERILLTLDIEFADLRKYPPGTHPGDHLVPSNFLRSTVNQCVYRRFYPFRGSGQVYLLCRYCRSYPRSGKIAEETPMTRGGVIYR